MFEYSILWNDISLLVLYAVFFLTNFTFF
jgi:hypothetical protein